MWRSTSARGGDSRPHRRGRWGSGRSRRPDHPKRPDVLPPVSPASGPAWNTVGVRIWICGVRGSTPAAGPRYVRYGGNTSCLAIAHDGELPSLILDSGTGIRQVSDLFGGSPDLLEGRPFEGAIILGHLHWDHTQGLPFFGAANNPDAHVDLYAPAQGDTEAVLARSMSPPPSPIPRAR